MATEPFTCVDCGWPKEKHVRDIPVKERPLAAVAKSGFTTSLERCAGYRPTRAERNTVQRPNGRGDEEAAWTP